MSESPFVAFMAAVGQAAIDAVAEIDGRLREFTVLAAEPVVQVDARGPVTWT